MTEKNGSQNFSKNSSSEDMPDQSSGINPSQEQPHPKPKSRFLDRTPQSLIEWLAHINRRYQSLNQEKSQDTS